jgi:hypothetical protein
VSKYAEEWQTRDDLEHLTGMIQAFQTPAHVGKTSGQALLEMIKERLEKRLHPMVQWNKLSQDLRDALSDEARAHNFWFCAHDDMRNGRLTLPRLNECDSSTLCGYVRTFGLKTGDREAAISRICALQRRVRQGLALM